LPGGQQYSSKAASLLHGKEIACPEKDNQGRLASLFLLPPWIADSVFLRRGFLSIIIVFIMAAAVISSSAYGVKKNSTTGVPESSAHIHDDSELNAELSLNLHSHGSVHHLNSDHTHDVNKLFSISTLVLPCLTGTTLYSGLTHFPQTRALPVPERPPRPHSA